MGELFSISSELTNRLEKCKEKYPNLRDFQYDPDSDILTFNGNSIKNAGDGINHIATIFFQMIPQDIFDYLKNGFYHQSEAELEKVKSMLSQEMIITEDEEAFLKKFARDYLRKIQMYANNKFLFDSNPNNPDLDDFLKDLKTRKDIMTNLGNNMSIAATIINSEVDSMTKQNQVQEESPEMEKGMSLTRTNPKAPSTQNFTEFPDQAEVNNLYKVRDFRGYCNMVLILVSAITLGMFIAIVTLGL